MESDYQTQKKTYDLLPNADENIEKLQVRMYTQLLIVS